MFRALARLIQTLLDVLLPPNERTVRLVTYTQEDIPIMPEEHELCGRTLTTLLSYQEPIVADVIRALKYDGSDHAANLLAQVFAEYLREEIANRKAFSTREIILSSVPLHPSRERERGFNQITRVLQALPTEFKDGTLSSINVQALIRTRATLQQTRLTRAERLANVEGAFALQDFSVINCHVILIDDVVTTGTTLTEAAKPLKGASVTLLALARA